MNGPLLPAAAKMPRLPFLLAWFRRIVLPGSATSIPWAPLRFDVFPAKRFPVEPVKLWIPSPVLVRTQFLRMMLPVVVNSSIPMWFPATVLWMIVLVVTAMDYASAVVRARLV